MRGFANWITGHRKTVIGAWIVALIAIGMIASTVGSDFSEEFSLPSSDSKDALDLLENRFPAQAGDVVQIVYRAEDGVESPAVKRTMEGVFNKVERLPHVSEVASPYEKGGAGAVSDDGKIAYATAQFDVTTDKLNDNEVKKLMDTARAAGGDGLQVEAGGAPVEEVRGEEEESFSEGIGVLAAVVVLLISFGSVVAMGLPLLTALFALGVGVSVITLFTHVFDTADFAPQLAFMIGLGVGVDYALFILTRFRNGLHEGLDKREAAIAAVDTAGRAVLFAGITVMISLMGMFLLGLPFLYGVATAAAVAVLFTMIAALTLLPALLSMVGPWVNRLRLPFFGRGTRSIDESSWWFRWSSRIQRRPWVAALLSGALLIALCIPTLSLRLGSNDAGTDPAGTTTREAYDLLAQGFGPGFNGPFSIVAALPGKGDRAPLEEVRRALEGERGVAATRPRTPASSRSIPPPRRRARRRPNCSTASAAT
jgi:RND superfamily putative drug exporter